MSTSPPEAAREPGRTRLAPVDHPLVRLLTPLLGLIVVVFIFQVLIPVLSPVVPLVKPGTSLSFSAIDLRIVAVQTVIVGIAAYGMTFIIVSAGIDLSVGSAIALTSVATAYFVDVGAPLLVALGMGVLTGAVCGLYNGLLVVLLRLPPFIATLGTMGFYRGLAKWWSGNVPITPRREALHGISEWVSPLSSLELLGFPPAVWVLLGLLVVTAGVLNLTVLGRHTFAIGSNEATARLCGIRVGWTKLMIYGFAGLLAGLAGVFQFARLTQGDPTVAIGLELNVIAAVVIGGASLNGGQGTILGSFAGAVLMAYLTNRCIALGWENYVQEIIVGHIIIAAVALDQWRARRAA